jgi:2-dehydro-3-deoxyglucarate aldolase/4-hydroxy-2-oxoheptanedioate aldolase
MKPNRFKKQMTEKNFAIGHMISEFGTRGQAKMLESADIDFVVIDREHGAFSTADIADLVAWFKATEIAPFVRIPQIQYHLIARIMDVGALGVMIPNVNTAAEARSILDAVKYAPSGKRGVNLGISHSDYRKVDPESYMAESNENTTIICQIESLEGLENLEDIAATDGIDVLWVGQGDLTQSMGIPGQYHHEKFLAALRHVVDIAGKNGLGAGIQPQDLSQAEEWMGLGFNVVSYGADHSVYIHAMNRAVQEIRRFSRKS